MSEEFLRIFHENVRISLILNNNELKISFRNSIGLFGSTSIAVAWLMSYEHYARVLPLCVLWLFSFGKGVGWRISGKKFATPNVNDHDTTYIFPGEGWEYTNRIKFTPVLHIYAILHVFSHRDKKKNIILKAMITKY